MVHPYMFCHRMLCFLLLFRAFWSFWVTWTMVWLCCWTATTAHRPVGELLRGASSFLCPHSSAWPLNVTRAASSAQFGCSSDHSYGHLLYSYNWLFLWDYQFYKWGFLFVLITGITWAITALFLTPIFLQPEESVSASLFFQGRVPPDHRSSQSSNAIPQIFNGLWSTAT